MTQPQASGVASKLNALLRLGLVSKNNVRRAMNVFQNPEKAMNNPANRTLMQELLIDVVDRIINNKSLYSLVRQNLVKDSSSPVTEDVSDERTKTLLRSGLVKKKDILLARKALSSKKNMKQMSQVSAYRELMIDMLDSMAKKITGNPVLFNAFKRTMGDQQADESFEMPNSESLMEFELNKDFTELLETHKPNNTKLWVESKKKAKGKFDTCPCENCEEAWAMKWYNEHDGEWTPISEGKSFFGFMDDVEQVDEVLTPKQKKIDINKNKKLDAGDFKALRTAKVSEETEQVDELSKPLLKRYLRAAVADDQNRMARGRKSPSRPSPRSANRLKGIRKAFTKLGEDVEQVDELSKGLLKRYKAAATVNADNLEKEGDRYSRNVQHGNLTPKEKKLSMKIRSRMYGKSDERRFKIGQAERKLRESVNSIEENLDLLNTALPYAIGGIQLVVILVMLEAIIDHNPFGTRPIAGKKNLFKNLMKKWNDRVLGGKLSADEGRAFIEEYEKLAATLPIGKRNFIKASLNKMSKAARDGDTSKVAAIATDVKSYLSQSGVEVKEDVEQVDELSKPLLKRYVKAATSNVISRQWKGDPADGQSRTQRSLKIGRATDKIRGVSRPKVKVFDEGMGVKEDVEQVDEAGQAKLYRMRYSHGRAWRRGDKKKQDAMGVATYDKQTKEDAKDLRRTGSAFGMRVKRLAGNRKAMGYSESTLIGKQKKLDVNKNKRLDAEDFKALRAKIRKGIK